MRPGKETLLARLRADAQYTLDVTGDRWWYDQEKYPHRFSIERHTLEPILGKNVSLQNITERRRAQGRTTHILELFGSGGFLTDPTAASSITGVRLRAKPYLDSVFEPNQMVVEGNIYEPTTMKLLRENLRERNIPAIDIAICAPKAGWPTWKKEFDLSVFLSVYYPLLQDVYSLLSSDNGILYTAVPKGIGLTQDALEDWTRRMNENGIPTRSITTRKGSLLQITKIQHSPSELVPLLGNCLTPSEERAPQRWSLLRRRSLPVSQQS